MRRNITLMLEGTNTYIYRKYCGFTSSPLLFLNPLIPQDKKIAVTFYGLINKEKPQSEGYNIIFGTLCEMGNDLEHLFSNFSFEQLH